MTEPWMQFILSAAAIIWAGNRLTRSAKTIAQNTNIGTAWAGALLLPLVTSLPELVTSSRAVLIDAPDLAVGNIFGSNLYNLTLLAVIDLSCRRGALTSRANPGHVLTASFSVIAVSLAAAAMTGAVFVPVGRVGGETIVIAGVYLFGSRLLFQYEKKHRFPGEAGSAGKGRDLSSTGRALLHYLFAAGLIVGAGVLLTDAADRIALETGLGRTFVGSFFLAAATSLPETVTTITAVKLGVLDMAVANVFGANFFNMFILFWVDLFYGAAPLLAVVSGTHLFSAVMVILLTTVMIIGLANRSQKELIGIGYDSLILLIGYAAAVYIIFKAGGN